MFLYLYKNRRETRNINAIYLNRRQLRRLLKPLTKKSIQDLRLSNQIRQTLRQLSLAINSTHLLRSEFHILAYMVRQHIFSGTAFICVNILKSPSILIKNMFNLNDLMSDFILIAGYMCKMV